ncbi:iron-containing alcohol dehydrogenase [bacterium]|nr:iron-containing alcohol dehydrogenase [bacterium]
MADNFRFHCPVKIVSGTTALEKLPSEFKQLNAKRPLIVTDPGVSGAGLLDLINSTFTDSDITVAVTYDRVPADSPLSSILEIVELYHQHACDSFLAVGGGSAIDTAKAANIKVTDRDIDLMHFKSVLRMNKTTQPLIAIPTTAGTGSEVTSAAVISNPDKGIKLSLINPQIPPNTAIIDPRMTATLPPGLTASTGMDALTHAVEACIGTQKNPISDAYAGSAIRLIARNLVEVVQNGGNLEARLSMANAATMAGIAFSNSMVGMVHALGHATGAVCHIPHGIAMSLYLADTLEFNLDTVSGFLGDLLPEWVGIEETAGTPVADRPTRFIEGIRQMRRKLNQLCQLPLTLREMGVTEDKLEEIARIAITDGAAYYNRKKFNEADALTVIRRVYAA